MLPHAEGFKEVIFCKETGGIQPILRSATTALAVVWHESIAGRCQEELIGSASLLSETATRS